MRKFDVAIIGGGLAGNLLARQLRRTLPHLEIGLFEKNMTTSYKVGESLVELASNYLIRRLGLSSYLYSQHLPKNGLRFFFDGPHKNVELSRMSEIGGLSFPYHPGFQIDRSRLEADLLQMNKEDGVVVHLGAKVKNLQLAGCQEGSPEHRFLLSYDGREEQCSSRWLIDATGRSSVLAKSLGLRIPEPNHALFAVWARFRGVADWDSVESDDFRKRIRFSSRMLSTNHFCYPGYWIWFIPLGRGITSIGVVGESAALQNSGLPSRETFLNFLRKHFAVSNLINGAEFIDLGSQNRLAYNTQQYFSECRWGVIGEAAIFTDPFYSPGSDFIALENDFLTNLIMLDEQGASADELGRMANLYNQYLNFRYESNMLLYRDLYSTIGSFTLLKLKWQFDFALYYHWWLSQYLQDLHLNENFLRSQLEERDLVINTLSNFGGLFKKIETHFKKKEQYYRFNSDQYSNSFEGVDFVEQVGLPQRGYGQLKRLNEILNRIYLQGLDLLNENTNGDSKGSLPLSRFTAAKALP
jgi:flavin-dependent dehydrogenase